jgi:hypothetical protein
MLREADLHLPKTGWGRIVLAASASQAGRAWTDEGTARQERGLKHSADNETRTILIPPVLVRLLRAHQEGSARPRTGGSSRPPGRHLAGLRLQRGLGPGPPGRPHPRPVPVAARPPPVRPAARGGVAVAELRGARDRGRPPRRARRRGPAEDLRSLHRRPGDRRQPANHRSPRTLDAEEDLGDEGDGDAEQVS